MRRQTDYENELWETDNMVAINRDETHFELPALRGIQQWRLYYSVMMEAADVATICYSKDALQKDNELPIEFRRQRKVSSLRAKRLYEYLMDAAIGKSNYILPSLTVTVDGPIEFVPIDEKPLGPGILRCRTDRAWLLADGQHRSEAIRRVRAAYYREEYRGKKLTRQQLWNLEDLLGHHLPIMVWHEVGDVAAQQIFADINRNVSKPDKELLDAFDHRGKVCHSQV